MINIQKNNGDKWLKWFLVIYLNPADNHLARISKIDKDFARKLVFKNIKFPVNIRYIHKIEKTNCISISVLGYENEGKFSIYV